MKTFELGDYIRNQRVSKNITLRKLEEISGISFSHLSKIERGTHQPSKETLEILAKSLDTDEYQLLLLAGYSTEADELFWKALYENIHPSWGIDTEKYIDQNGNTDYMQFRNDFVHGFLDEDLKEKISEHFFEFASNKTTEINTSFYLSNDRKIVDEIREDMGKEYEQWLDLIDEFNQKGLTPEDIKNIIEFAKRMKNESYQLFYNLKGKY